jgi:hypothetical protein
MVEKLALRVLQIWEEVEGKLVPARYRLQMWTTDGWEDVPTVHQYPSAIVSEM